MSLSASGPIPADHLGPMRVEVLSGPALAASLRRLQCGWQIDQGQVDCLTPREREVLALLSMGLSNRHMARLLGVTERTIKTHVGRILAKLGLESRLQAGLAALMYCAQGWARPPGS